MRYPVIVWVLALGAGGCQDKGPPPPPESVAVSGKLLLANGSPVAAGTLVLRPVNGLHGATAPIGKDGSFTLTDSAGRPGVIPGQYLVYVRFPNPEDAAMRGTVPARYQSTEDADSDVTVDIPSATDKLLIKLKR